MKARRLIADFARDRSAAIAPMYAIALFGLIMIAGVGWDYSRLMTMDSELQNAADQAALAAATQLNGLPGAMDNAELAATNFFTNETKLANDGGGRAVDVLTFEFFQEWDHATDEPGAEADDDSNARYVRVTVGGRQARYALTAIGGLLSSGDIRARAVATLESAACNIPPLAVCAPDGNAAFPTAADVGIALDLREMPQSSSTFSPGFFDLLNIDYEGLTNNDQQVSLGLNSDFLGCTGEPLETEPGRRDTQDKALNSRFGIYQGRVNQADCDPARTGSFDFCPADLTRHDRVRKIEFSRGFRDATCANSEGGELIPVSEVPVTPVVPPQGLPLDTCQTDGSGRCDSFGDGIWPVAEYMQNVHPTSPTEGLDVNGDGKTTRYDVYNWERADPSRTESRQLARVQGRNQNQGTLYCTAPKPVAPTPIEGKTVAPSNTQRDRRVVTVAVIDCAGNNGRFDVNAFKFVDMFLLGPITENGGEKQLRAEIIGPARRADGGSGFQTFGRKKAVLVQ